MQKAIILVGGLLLLAPPILLTACAAPGDVRVLQSITPGQGDARGDQPAPAGDEKKLMLEVVVTYSLANGSPTLLEPVLIDFTVENRLEQSVNLDLGADRKESFQFKVKQPDGMTIELPQLRAEGLSRVGRLTVGAGQTYTQRVLLNEWYEFPSPGKYELSARLTKPIRTSEGAGVVEPAEFHTTLEVQPRNAERLQQIAAGLAEQVTNAPSYEEAAQAARALSYVKDPVAVPYLEKALSSGRMVEPIVIAGLERIGGEEAIRALTAASVSQDEETAELARAALERVKGKGGHDKR